MSFSVILNKIKQYPIAVVSALFLIVLGVLFFLRRDIVDELTSEESELVSRIRTIDTNSKNSNNLGQDVEELRLIVEGIEERLFSRSERAINVNFFYAFEDRVDVVVSNISQLPEPDPLYDAGGPRELKLHSTLVFKITFSGSYRNILLFLYELHRVDPLIRVADLRLGSSKGQVDAETLEASVRVLVMGGKDS